MYTQYFGFQRPPFKITPDSGFFYTNSIFLNAHNSLLDAIDEQRGLALLTGASGTGKTTLLKQLAQDLDDTVHFIYLQNANLSQRDLVGCLSDKLGGEASDQQQISVEAEIFRLRDHLKSLNDREQGCVLFIDDAQNLPLESLNTLPLLIKADGGGNQVQVVLSGTEDLLERLNQPVLSAVSRLVEAHAQLERLPAAEIPAFIDHQIRGAGSMRSDIFSEGAIREIMQTSSGRPSDLNRVCDKALEIAYRQGTQVVTREMIRQTSSAAWLSPEPQASGTTQRPNSVRRLAEKFRPSGGGGRFAASSIAEKLAALRQRLPNGTSAAGQKAAHLARKIAEKSGVFALVALAKLWRLISRLTTVLRSTARWRPGQSGSTLHAETHRPSRRRIWVAGSAAAAAVLLAVLILPLVNDSTEETTQSAAVQADEKTTSEQTASGRRLTALAELRAQIAQLKLDLKTAGSNRDYMKRLVGSLTSERD
ncbi:AAA family ATPase, partial [Moorena sp. SIO3E8]|uniref:ExeA family protein n=1 Tax=Moorena sp. SIO3E8 TaxID=2607830 RepID=UPI001417E06E